MDEARDLKDVPQFLSSLYTDIDNPFRSNFLENIRQYNSALALASIKANFDEKRPGIFVYKIHGQTYFRSADLHPTEDRRRAYGQLYVIDSDQANAERMNRPENHKCDERLMKDLDSMLRTHHSFAKRFMTVAEIEKEEEKRRGVVTLKMMFSKTPGLDMRVYNEPTSSEVAVVFTGPDGGAPDRIDLSICNRNGRIQTINHCSPNCDPMTFPLLFPNGEFGWDPSMEHDPSFATVSRKRLTLLEFSQYRLAVRPGFSTLHSAQKLFQQYAVTTYTR